MKVVTPSTSNRTISTVRELLEAIPKADTFYLALPATRPVDITREQARDFVQEFSDRVAKQLPPDGHELDFLTPDDILKGSVKLGIVSTVLPTDTQILILYSTILHPEDAIKPDKPRKKKSKKKPERRYFSKSLGDYLDEVTACKYTVPDEYDRAQHSLRPVEDAESAIVKAACEGIAQALREIYGACMIDGDALNDLLDRASELSYGDEFDEMLWSSPGTPLQNLGQAICDQILGALNDDEPMFRR